LTRFGIAWTLCYDKIHASFPMRNAPKPIRFFPLALAALVLLIVVIAVLWMRRDDIRQSMGSGGTGADSIVPEARVEEGNGHTVLLISLDGFSGTYLDESNTPHLYVAAREGAFSTRLRPPFPSLTFPSHVTLATGRLVSGHGIPGNSFYLAESGEELRFPGDASLLLAEPIWTTAARQGLRVLSYDWPLSHQQSGPYRAAYFESSFNPALSDRDRLMRVLELWEEDPARKEGEPPLRLVTGYAKEADSVGHRHGPDAEETREAVREVDALVGEVMDRAIAIFERDRIGGDQLYLIFVADHGMAAVTHYVNIEALLGVELSDAVVAVTGGNLANLHLKDPDSPEAPRLLERVDAAFEGFAQGTLYRPETLPEEFAYRVDGRTGDRIVVLEAGHTFNRAGVRSVSRVGEVPGLLGMHGYDVEEVREMKGSLVVRRYPDPLGGVDLGVVEATRLHATVAAILGIDPAEGADLQALEIW